MDGWRIEVSLEREKSERQRTKPGERRETEERKSKKSGKQTPTLTHKVNHLQEPLSCVD